MPGFQSRRHAAFRFQIERDFSKFRCCKPIEYSTVQGRLCLVERTDTHTDRAVGFQFGPVAETFFAICRPFLDTLDCRCGRIVFFRRSKRQRLWRAGIRAFRADVAIGADAEWFGLVNVQWQIGEDFRKADAGTEFACEHHLIAAIFTEPGLDRIGNDQSRIVHRGYCFVAEIADIGGELNDDGCFVGIFHPGCRTCQCGRVGRNKPFIHGVAHDDHMGQTAGQIIGGRGKIPRVDARRIMPALIDLGDADKIGTEHLGERFDFPGLIIDIINGHLGRRHRRVILYRGLKTLPLAFVIAPVGNQIRNDPGGVAQRKIPLCESFTTARHRCRAVAGKECVSVFGPDGVVPEGPCEHVVHLIEWFESVADFNASRRVARRESGIQFGKGFVAEWVYRSIGWPGQCSAPLFQVQIKDDPGRGKAGASIMGFQRRCPHGLFVGFQPAAGVQAGFTDHCFGDRGKSMIQALKENWALFAGMLMLMAANGLLSTLLTIRGASIGLSDATIGLMQAGYPLGALLGSAYTPKLVERVGHVRAFAALASLCSVSAIVHLVTIDALSWGAMRFLAGFCFPGLYVISESWLNAKADNRSRAVVLSAYFVIQTLGASLGQGLAGLDDPGGTVLFVLTSILISLSLLPLMISRNPAPNYEAPERLSVVRLARISPVAISGALLNGAMQAAFYIGVPLFGLSLGMSAAEATLLLVVGTLAGATAQFPVGWISDRTDRRIVVSGLSFVCVCVCLALFAGLFGDNVYPAIALIGAMTLPVYSICVAHANDQIQAGQIVPASGTLVLTLNVGILFGAFAGPFSIGVVGPMGLVGLFAVLAAMTASVAGIRSIRAEAPEQAGPAQPIAVQGTQTTGLLHPDAEESSTNDKRD